MVRCFERDSGLLLVVFRHCSDSVLARFGTVFCLLSCTSSISHSLPVHGTSKENPLVTPKHAQRIRERRVRSSNQIAAKYHPLRPLFPRPSTPTSSKVCHPPPSPSSSSQATQVNYEKFIKSSPPPPPLLPVERSPLPRKT